MITDVDLITGTIFEADNFGQFDLNSSTSRNAAVSTTVFFDAVTANGLLATLTISTEGITGPGQFDLTLSSTGLGDTQFFDLLGNPVDATVNDRVLNIVPEPAAALLWGLPMLMLGRRRV
ncbi:MAG: hypothetical protein AAGG38_00350 [Planctomycetota bacterium]